VLKGNKQNHKEMVEKELLPELLNGSRSQLKNFRQSTLKYSRDGKYLFQREAHVVRVLSAKNGQLLFECIRSNESKIRPEVTSLALHPTNKLQIYASYLDGKGMRASTMMGVHMIGINIIHD
jgi:hypothetical protein